MIFKSKCGKYDIIVDDEDYQKVIDFAPNGWEVKYFTGSNNPYVITRKTINKVRKQFLLHRLIMNVLNQPDVHIDHKFQKTLDNRKSELREVTRSQNMKNRTSAKNSSSKYLGVYVCNYKKTKKYRVTIKDTDKNRMNLGYYENEDSAGFAYDVAANIIHGEYANLNIVDVENVEIIKIRTHVLEILKNFGYCSNPNKK